MIYFQTKKSQFGKILEGLPKEDVGTSMAIWSILLPFGIVCGHLVYFVAIWYILRSFGMIFPILVSCTKKNLATLERRGGVVGCGVCRAATNTLHATFNPHVTCSLALAFILRFYPLFKHESDLRFCYKRGCAR
jgi:hypothetical protein